MIGWDGFVCYVMSDSISDLVVAIVIGLVVALCLDQRLVWW